MTTLKNKIISIKIALHHAEGFDFFDTFLMLFKTLIFCKEQAIFSVKSEENVRVDIQKYIIHNDLCYIVNTDRHKVITPEV